MNPSPELRRIKMKGNTCTRIVACTLLLLAVGTQFGVSRHAATGGTKARKSPESPARGGISQVIEFKNGRPSCVGVKIAFSSLRLRDTLEQDQLEVVDAKYARDIKGIMAWKVLDRGRGLLVKFKSGMGDFGTGNSVTLRIAGAAFDSSPLQTYSFTIPTDPL
jgi:hypothetical protein